MIDLEQFKKDYLIELLSIAKLCKKYDISLTKLNKLVAELSLVRDKHAVKSKSNSVAKNKMFEKLKETLTFDILNEYYIIQDHDYYNTLKHFKLTDWSFNRLLDEYSINKDKSKTAAKGLATKYKNSGGKDVYHNQVTQKRNNTLIQKYSTMEDYYCIRREKTESNNIKKYGFKYKCTKDLIENHSETYLNVWHSKEKSIEYLTSLDNKSSAEELALSLNCSINSLHLWVEKYDLGNYIKITKSSYEQELIDFINGLGFNIVRNSRKILDDGKELDIYVPDKKLAVEFNGNYFHSSEKIAKNYHYNKSIDCEKKGIRLIHVYQYQWLDLIKKEILKSIIVNALGKNTSMIYARKCEVKELKKRDVEEFSIRNSLHGHRNASIYLGLFYNNELVELMSFGKAFFSRDKSIDYECIRSITKVNTSVVGGMNKLFSYFINKYAPNKVLYYVDYNTHNGTSMGKLNFKLESYSKHDVINIANCKEIEDRFGYVFNRKPTINKEIQEYIAQGKILTIYGAGVKRYIWSK